MNFILSEFGGSQTPRKFANALFAYPEDVYEILNKEAIPECGKFDLRDEFIKYMFLLREEGDGNPDPALQLRAIGNNFTAAKSTHSRDLTRYHDEILHYYPMDIPESILFDNVKIDVNMYHAIIHGKGSIICFDKVESIQSITDYTRSSKYHPDVTKQLTKIVENNEPIGVALNVSMSLFTPAKDHYFNGIDEVSRLKSSLIIFQYAGKYDSKIREALK